MIQVSGYELKGILSQRITIPPSGSSHQSFSSIEAETIIKDVVTRNCVTLYPFSKLNIVADSARGSQYDFNTRYGVLLDEIVSLAKLAELGLLLTINTTTQDWDFDVSEGNDLTSTGGAINPVIFSTEYDNIQRQEYITSNFNSANYAIVGGSGEGVARVIEETGTTDTDTDLYITFVDASDLSVTSEIEARGQESLTELAPIETFDCDVLPSSNYTYETDYDIGDLVTIQDRELNITVDKRIESVTEFYSSDGFNITLGFGESLKGVRDLITLVSNKEAIK